MAATRVAWNLEEAAADSSTFQLKHRWERALKSTWHFDLSATGALRMAMSRHFELRFRFI